MKLPLVLGFALLLMLQESSTSTFKEDTDEDIPSDNRELETEISSGALSGDGESNVTNDTTEGITVIPGLSEEPDEMESIYNSTTAPNHTVLSFGSEPTVETNGTSVQKDNTSRPVSPDLRPPMTNETGLNSTVTPQPKTNSTESGSGSYSSNETTTNTSDTKNSTNDIINSTTTHPPHANITQSPPNIPVNVTIQRMSTRLPGNESKTVQMNTTTMTTKLNRTGGSFGVRDSLERGLASDTKQKAKSQAWGAIVGFGVAVGIVALVVYVIMKRRSHRDFSHRKLVEETAPEPVLRLDNNEPLDLKYHRFAYYNPGLQGDNIQMTSFPQGHPN